MGMDAETRELFEQATHAPRESDVFAGKLPSDVSIPDVFGGDETLHRRIERAQGPRLLSRAGAVAGAAGRFWTPAHSVILANILVIGAVLTTLWFRGPGARPTAGPEQSTGSTGLPQVQLSRTTAAVLDESISWDVAQGFLQAGDVTKAYYVFEKLHRNLTAAMDTDEYLKDLLALQMAVCLSQMEQPGPAGVLFSQALQSRSPAVRALANYQRMFMEMRARHFDKARMRAYKTLALLPTIQEAFSANIEADCHFIAVEALTKQVLLLSNHEVMLPGRLWSDSLRPESLPAMTQEELQAFLGRYTEALATAALVPRIVRNPSVSVGSQWSAAALDAPLEEFLARWASQAEQNIAWSADLKEMRTRPVTLYLPAAAQQTVPEIAAGSAGLIVEFDTQGLLIHNPDLYQDLGEHKKRLCREAISVWRRFLLRYRGDHRTPNAHYAMGLLQENIDQPAAALAEYKLVYGQFAHSSLAPYALLNSSRIKAQLRDYRGAQSDLTELLVQYPDCEVVDEASLFLAEATLNAGLYDEAVGMFRRVYNLNVRPDSRCRAAYGAGHCAFELGDYESARSWLIQAIQLTQDPTDRRLGPAYLMLGRALMQLNDYGQAATAFNQAMGLSLGAEDFAEVTLELVEVECRQGNYVTAYDMLQRIPVERLPQYYASRVLVAKARLLREIGLVDTAITLLRRKIEFFADAETRARMTLELARCQVARGDLRIAREDLVEVLGRLREGPLFDKGQLLLAEICVGLEDYAQTERICRGLLSRTESAPAERQRALVLLGQAYEGLARPRDAARAYAGLVDTSGGTQP
ncbi:MAG TPA: tetratricopeptide repeat protein [Phycisphaerales bacterium]|nr:tetratricopeptide repeat protein [Phycisphaerales bacterium]